MKIIGLTGGIGSGKSTVLNFFKELDIPVYISDFEAKRIMNSSKAVITQVVKLFGEEAYVKGQVNRKFIAAIVFNDKGKLNALNKIVHPAVHRDFQEFVKRTKAAYVIYESALLFENKSEDQFDFIVLVVAPIEERIERVQKRDRSTITEVKARIANQLSDTYKIEKSDYVLLNTDMRITKREVVKLHKLFLK